MGTMWTICSCYTKELAIKSVQIKLKNTISKECERQGDIIIWCILFQSKLDQSDKRKTSCHLKLCMISIY